MAHSWQMRLLLKTAGIFLALAKLKVSQGLATYGNKKRGRKEVRGDHTGVRR